jgi:hypothetical protein
MNISRSEINAQKRQFSMTPSERVSSRLTVFYQIVIPSLSAAATGIIIGVSYLFGGYASNGSQPVSSGAIFAIAILGFLVTFVLVAMLLPLKRIDIGDKIYIRGLRKVVDVRFEDIKRVDELSYLTMSPIFLHFRFKTLFGDSVIFLPRMFPLTNAKSQPIVQRLRTLALRAAAEDSSVEET